MFAIAETTVAAGTGALEEIVVTARQREERLVDVPATITAFTQETITRAGIERPEDFVRLTPGIVMTNNVEAGDAAVSIRGINKARDGEQSFAFLVDGVLITNPSAFNREFDDLAQIEIVKGPQSALYGRSAIAGAIIVQTRKPTDDYEAGVKLQGGNNDTFFGSAYVSGPLIEGELYGRLHANYRTTDGFFRDSFLDSAAVDNLENYNIDGRLLWEPNDQLEIDTKLRYSEVPDAGAIRFNQSFGFFEDVNDHDFVWQQNIRPVNEQETIEFSIKADYDMGWATATTWFLYNDIEELVYADGTQAGSFVFATEPNCIASTANLFAQGVTLPPPSFLGPTPFASALLPFYGPTTCDGFQTQTREQTDYSVEFRLTSSADQRLRWQVGFYYLSLDRNYALGQGIDTGEDRTIRNAFVPGLTESLIQSDFDTEVIAGFGSIAYDITPDIEFSFALRWDEEDRSLSNGVPPPNVATTQYVDFLLPADGIPGGSPLNPVFGFQAGQLVNSTPDRNKAFSQWQPKVSLTWDVTDQHTLFASWGIGFKSGGFNAAGSAEIVDVFINQAIGTPVLNVDEIFRKEVTSAFEIGFKSRFADGRVAVEGAVFYTDVDDMQFFEFVVGQFGLLRTVTNIDEVSLFGAELGVNAQITDQLNVYAGWSILNGEIDRHDGRPTTVGNEVPYAPKWTGNVGGQYVTPSFLDGVDFLARIDWSLVGPTWFHAIQDQSAPTVFGFPADYTNTERDTYDTIDIRVGFEGPNWSLTGFVRNLTNEKYLDEVIPVPELGGSNVAPGMRRAWGVQASYNWD